MAVGDGHLRVAIFYTLSGVQSGYEDVTALLDAGNLVTDGMWCLLVASRWVAPMAHDLLRPEVYFHSQFLQLGDGHQGEFQSPQVVALFQLDGSCVVSDAGVNGALSICHGFLVSRGGCR